MIKLEGLNRTIHQERYSHPGELEWEDTVNRVIPYIAQAETDPVARQKFIEDGKQLLGDLDVIPGGRILTNAGRPDGMLLNCFVIDIDDSREAIGEAVKNYLIISGTGGGVGLSFKKIRPKGAAIVKSGGESSGSVSFMDVINSVADTIKIGGGRRAATMISLPADHPDVIQFVHHKMDLGKLNNANVSVEISDKFIKAVEEDKDWDLIWAGKVIKTIKARELWDYVVANSLSSGEPGFLNLELANKMSNSHYYNRLSTTNPCGEIFLPIFGVCCLSSINVANFILPEGGLDLPKFRAACAFGVRLLDNVLTVNSYPLPNIKEVATAERRIGLGLTGVHTAMLKQGIKYSSRAGIAFIEHCYEELRNASYLASIDIAKEKGSFQKFDPERYLESGFVKTLPASIRRKIAQYGIRNVCVNTQAPTGTTSLLAGVSSGIEPIFAPIFKRTFFSDKSSTGRKEQLVLDEEVKTQLDTGKSFSELKHFEGAYDVPVRKHLMAQEAAQRYIDQAVSKTINLPEDYTFEQLSEDMLKFAPVLKGTTIYRAGSRGFEPLQAVEFTKDNLKLALEGGATEVVDNSCLSGKCSIG